MFLLFPTRKLHFLHTTLFINILSLYLYRIIFLKPFFQISIHLHLSNCRNRLEQPVKYVSVTKLLLKRI